jgi:hypothetical protein
VNGADVFAQVMFVIMSSIAALVAIGVGGRYVWKRTSRIPEPAPRVDNDRLQRIEEAIDTMSVEIERMSEAQRFTAKLLLERGSTPEQAPNAQVPAQIVNRR